MKLNPSRVGTRRALSSDQVMHAMVLSSFPQHQDGDRVLWRVDPASRHDVVLYVVSSARPDMTGMVEQAGWPLEATWRTAPYERLLDRLDPGQRWRFRLTANPTVSQSRGQGQRGHVRPCRTAGQQEEWFYSQCERMGIDVGEGAGSMTLIRRDVHRFTRSGAPAGRGSEVTLTKATYEGVLTVQDADRLRKVLVSGIGRGKAYGCGLLTLAP